MKDGELSLKLDEETITLKATPHALRVVLTKHGGMRKAIEKVFMMESDIMEDIIEAGLAPEKINRQILSENVFKTGIINLVGPLTEYLMLLANGGKKPEENKPKGDGDSEGEN